MRKTLLIVAALTLFTLGSQAHAETENVYVRLYTERVNVAKATVLGAEAEAEFEAARLDRARRLLASNAISREEYDGILAASRKANADILLTRALVAEAEAMLEVVKSLLAGGEAVPLCR